MARRIANNKKQKTLKPIYVIFILFFVAGITFLVLSLIAPKDNSDDTTNTSETSSKEDDDTGLEEIGRGGDDVSDLEKTPEQYDEIEESTNTIKGYITRNEISNNEYQLYISINELVGEKGSCTLDMESSNGSSIKNQKGTIHPSASTSDCAFNIDKKYIPEGTYRLTVTIKSGDRSGKVEGNIKI